MIDDRIMLQIGPKRIQGVTGLRIELGENASGAQLLQRSLYGDAAARLDGPEQLELGAGALPSSFTVEGTAPDDGTFDLLWWALVADTLRDLHQALARPGRRVFVKLAPHHRHDFGRPRVSGFAAYDLVALAPTAFPGVLCWQIQRDPSTGGLLATFCRRIDE